MDRSERVIRGWTVFGPLALAGVLVAWWSGVRHDYSAYLDHWAAAIRLGNPWADRITGHAIDPNAYGPLAAVIGFTTLLHPLAPKLLFAVSAFGVAGLLLSASVPIGETDRRRAAALVFLLSPLVAIAVFWFGDNDVVAALAVALACALRQRGRFAAAGLALALGGLEKFYPLLFAGFLALDDAGTLRLRRLFMAGTGFALGMAAGWLAWGAALWSPLVFGQDRDPSLMAPLALTSFDAVLVHRIGRAFDIAIWHNGAFVLLIAAAAMLHAWHGGSTGARPRSSALRLSSSVTRSGTSNSTCRGRPSTPGHLPPAGVG